MLYKIYFNSYAFTFTCSCTAIRSDDFRFNDILFKVTFLMKRIVKENYIVCDDNKCYTS